MTNSTLSKYVKFEDGKTKIEFRNPTVRDCCKFDQKDVSIEQIALTEFLDHMQTDGGKRYPSELWTEKDRITALWYIYIQSREDKTIVQEYTCSHCNKVHKRPLDLTLLADGLREAVRPMEESITVLGEPAKIVPLRGYAMEHLEQVANYRDSLRVTDFEDEAAYEQEYLNADHEMYLLRVAHQLELSGEDENLTHQERAEIRLDKLLGMTASDFKVLASKVRLISSAMQHGLESEIQDGRTLLVTPEHECPEVEGAKTRLMLPFHFNQFVPSF